MIAFNIDITNTNITMKDGAIGKWLLAIEYL